MAKPVEKKHSGEVIVIKTKSRQHYLGYEYRILLICIVLAAHVSLLSSCRSKSADPPPVEEEKVTIFYSRSIDSTVASRMVIEEFNKTHPHIEVVLRQVSGLTGEQHDQYITDFSMKNTDFDVFDADIIWVAEFADAGYVAPVDALIKRDGFDIDNFIEGSIRSVTYKGKIWGIQRYVDAGVLFYRKDLVEKAPQTWEELILIASAHTGKGGTRYGFDFQARRYEGLVCNALEYIHSYGGAVLDREGRVTINSKEAARGLETFIKIVTSDLVPPNIINYTEKESQVAFLSGHTVFSRNWPYIWTLSEKSDLLSGKVGVAPLPAGDTRNAATLGGAVAMINSRTPHLEEAWEFVQFLSGPEGQKIRAIYGGHAPSYIPLYKDKEVLEANPHYGDEGFFNALASAVPRPVSPIYPYLSEIIQLEVYKTINQEQTVEESLSNMEMKIKQAIADYEAEK